MQGRKPVCLETRTGEEQCVRPGWDRQTRPISLLESRALKLKALLTLGPGAGSRSAFCEVGATFTFSTLRELLTCIFFLAALRLKRSLNVTDEDVNVNVAVLCGVLMLKMRRERQASKLHNCVSVRVNPGQ